VQVQEYSPSIILVDALHQGNPYKHDHVSLSSIPGANVHFLHLMSSYAILPAYSFFT
jgi:hypothetical protein